MKDRFTPKQVALAIGASEASVKRWCDRGVLAAQRTPGGHRRVPCSEVFRFLRESGHPVVRPEVLGLPPSVGSERRLDQVDAHLRAALSEGDADRFRRLVFNLYLSGLECATIFDRHLSGVFESLGDLWQHHDLEIYQERRACEICIRLVHELRGAITPPAEDANQAIGGTLSADMYSLPTAMVELSLREHGWRAVSLGVGLPEETLSAAIRRERPRLFWLSVSHVAAEEDFLAAYSKLYETAKDQGVPVAVGGRALDEELRHQMRYTAYCDQIKDVVAFAESLRG